MRSSADRRITIDRMVLTKHPLLDICLVNIDNYLDMEEYFETLLCAVEKKRASAFKFAFLRRNYSISHGILRCLIARYLRIGPQEVAYVFNQYGKPSLNHNSVKFNMSHSRSYVVFAFSKDTDVGIDIEYINPNISIDQLPLGVFHQLDQDAITSHSPSIQKTIFYKKWVQMEALLKAKGKGLFGVSSLRELSWYKNWTFQEIPVAEDYISGVAYYSEINERPIPRIMYNPDLNS